VSGRRKNREGSYWKETRSGKVFYRQRSYITMPSGAIVRVEASGLTVADMRKRFEQRMIEAKAWRPASRNDTFQELCESWLERRADELKARTLEDYRYTLQKYVYPTFGRQRATAIRPLRWDEFLSDFARGGKLATGNKVRRIVKALYGYLVRRELIEVNPLAELTGRQMPKQRVLNSDGNLDEELTIWSSEEAQALMSSLSKTRERPLFVLLLFCGLRLGEAQALKWSDFSEDYSKVQVQRAHSEAEPGKLSTPKTRHSIRTIPTGQFVQSVLREHRAFYESERRSPNYVDQGFVFSTSTGTMYSQSNLRRTFLRAIEAANKAAELDPTKPKLRRIRLHDLRHFFASQMARRHQPQVIQKLLGHSSPDLAQRIYVHVHGRDLQNATLEPEHLD